MRPAAYTSFLDSASATAYTTLTGTPCQGSWLFLSSPPGASWVFCGGRITSESLGGPEAQRDIVRTHTRRENSILEGYVTRETQDILEMKNALWDGSQSAEGIPVKRHQRQTSGTSNEGM